MLGPTDLESALSSSGITMYADDATSYHAASTCHKLNLDLSREPYVGYDWIQINKYILNASKTKSKAFGSRHIFISKPKLDLYISDNKWTRLNCWA